MPVRSHPHYERSGGGKAGHQDKKGDEQQMPALITREVWK